MAYLNDELLVVNYQQSQDAKSLELLYRSYSNQVQKYIYTIVKDNDLAVDLMHDTFIKVAEKLITLKNPITFQSWLFTIARNMALLYLRKNKLIISEPSTLLVCMDKNEEEELLEANIVLLETSMNELTEEERFLIIEKYYQNKSIIELCQLLNCGESAIKMKIHRTRQKIYNLMTRKVAV